MDAGAGGRNGARRRQLIEVGDPAAGRGHRAQPRTGAVVGVGGLAETVRAEPAGLTALAVEEPALAVRRRVRVRAAALDQRAFFARWRRIGGAGSFPEAPAAGAVDAQQASG